MGGLAGLLAGRFGCVGLRRVSIRILILVIADVAGVSAVVGCAPDRFSETRKLQDARASCDQMVMILVIAPGGIGTFLDGGGVA